MKRRNVLRSILSLPAIAAFPASAQAPAPEKTRDAQQKLPAELKPPTVEETPKLDMTTADAAVPPTTAFFSPEQFQTLQRLCELLVPPFDGKPGAKETGVPEFLDFLISRSPRERQHLYQHGLELLDRESRRRFNGPFWSVSASQAGLLLEPLRATWTFADPAADQARFLAAAKDDVLRATVNSREWAQASTGRRRGNGTGTYWYALD